MRAKEEEFNKAQDSDVDCNADNITVRNCWNDISLKQGVWNATKVGYNFGTEIGLTLGRKITPIYTT